MNEKKLLALAFLGSLFGIFALYILSGMQDYGAKTVDEVNDEKIAEIFKVEGEVISCFNSGNHTFIKISQPDYLDIILFNSNVELEKGDKIEAIGRQQVYNDKKEVIAQRVRVIQ